MFILVFPSPGVHSRSQDSGICDCDKLRVQETIDSSYEVGKPTWEGFLIRYTTNPLSFSHYRLANYTPFSPPH